MKNKSLTLCTNCNKPTGGRAVMSPSLDPKRRNQCVECSVEWMESTCSCNQTQPTKQTQEWEKELTEILDGVYEHRLKEVEAANRINKYISQALFSQLEEVEEMVFGSFTCIGPTDEIHRCSWGHCERCGVCDVVSGLLSKIQEMKGKI